MSIERGTLLYRTGRHELAEQEFRAALAADPADALAHAMLGHCLLQRQQFDEAAAEAQQAIQLRPDWDAGYATVAAVFNGRHRLPEAAIAIERAIGLAPFNPDHRALLANVRFQQRRWADALAAADAGLAIDPRHPGCVNARAMALVSLGRRDEATATLGGQLARDPHSAVTQANQGWALLHAGDHRAALEHFREALRINPELQWAKSGIVEALKARNVIYRVMLRYFLFMSRMSRQVQWGIILGGYFGYQALATASRDSPGVRPYVVPVMAVSRHRANPLLASRWSRLRT
jgi:tetratricopeptide (TPR) repeat protein